MRERTAAVKDLFEAREREFLMSKVRVTMRSPLENIDAGDFKIESAKEGEPVEVPRWVAEELVKLNVAEAPEDAFESEMLKSLSREKMMGPLQLSSLQRDFYVRLRRRLQRAAADVEAGKGRREDYEKLRAASYDLIGMRLSKLLSLSSSSTTLSALGDRLTPEEREFFGVSQSLSKEWKGALLGNGV